MSTAVAMPLSRAHSELEAAHALLDAGFPSQAASHAYYAGYHAASAAVFQLGETPSTPAGTITAFVRLVVGNDGVDHTCGSKLRTLFEDRQHVDHALAEPPADYVRQSIADAEQLVDATARWLETRFPQQSGKQRGRGRFKRR